MKKCHTPKKYLPAQAIQPGEILLDELKARGLSLEQLSQMAGMPARLLRDISEGKQDIHETDAQLLGAALEMDAVIWLNLQRSYEMEKKLIKGRS